ncbi:hypothetical protein [Domibacillus aminovorans]|uniref:Phage protein n=1 Tax=Domibacillus aminovorans TaxID=29332 RepID=A0A177L393_9BACI|nr:hypothetical protein [Domibacillus aminovorans]OAH60138.1 hypothetical protein AWH49_17950 [Domibacillus aminovorans]
MNSSLKEQLKQWKKDHQNVKLERKKEKPLQKKQEKLSQRELRSLMGMDMRTLRRGKGGAYK